MFEGVVLFFSFVFGPLRFLFDAIEEILAEPLYELKILVIHVI